MAVLKILERGFSFPFTTVLIVICRVSLVGIVVLNVIGTVEPLIIGASYYVNTAIGAEQIPVIRRQGYNCNILIYFGCFAHEIYACHHVTCISVAIHRNGTNDGAFIYVALSGLVLASD